MKHNAFEDLQSVAKVTKIERRPPWQGRRERLLRLAGLVESYDRPVQLFHQLEFMPYGDRYALRLPGSPLALAFADPALRAQGLKGDDYGSALDFFELTEHEAHELLCDCHYSGHKPQRQLVGARIRAIANRQGLRERLASLKQRILGYF